MFLRSVKELAYFKVGLSTLKKKSIIFASMGVQIIALEGNCSPVRVSVWVTVRVKVGGQFCSGAIALELL